MDNRNHENERRLVLLIDAENIPAERVEAVVRAAEKHGRVVEKRVFADWVKSQVKSWRLACVTAGMVPVQCFAFHAGKNATDFQIVIHTMKLLLREDVDGICIASSDCDFANLASEIRMAGKLLVGIGTASAPAEWQQVCDRWEDCGKAPKVQQVKKPAPQPVEAEAPAPQSEPSLPVEAAPVQDEEAEPAVQDLDEARPLGKPLSKAAFNRRTAELRSCFDRIFQAYPKGLDILTLQRRHLEFDSDFRVEDYGWRNYGTFLRHMGLQLHVVGSTVIVTDPKWQPDGLAEEIAAAQAAAKQEQKLRAKAEKSEKAEQELELFRKKLLGAIGQNKHRRLSLADSFNVLAKAKKDIRLADYGVKKTKDLVLRLGFTVTKDGAQEYVTA